MVIYWDYTWIFVKSLDSNFIDLSARTMSGLSPRLKMWNIGFRRFKRLIQGLHIGIQIKKCMNMESREQILKGQWLMLAHSNSL